MRLVFVLLGLIGFNFFALAKPYQVRAKINPAIQKKYEKFEVMESRVLASMGEDFYGRQRMDSALICFTIIANRYKESMRDLDKSACAQAYYRCGTIYLYRFNDYTMALQNMQTAMSIAQECGDKELLPRVYIHMGNIYVFYADQHKSDEMMQTGFGMYRKAMRLGVEVKQWDNAMLAYIDIMSCTPEFAEKLDIYQDVDYFRSLQVPPQTPLLTHVNAMTDGLLLMKSHQYQKAIDAFNTSCQAVEDTKDPGILLRYQFSAICHITECYMFLGEFDKAISLMQSMEQQAEELHLTDLMPEIYSRCEVLCSRAGNNAMGQQYHLKYLETKDSLIHSNSLGGVKDMHFLHELNKLNDQLTESAYQRERQKMMILGGGMVLLAVLIFLIVIYRKNRKLNSHNKILYQRMQEVIKTSALTVEIEPAKETNAESGRDTEEVIEKKIAAGSMSDEQKSLLLSRLLEKLSDPDVLCASDLTEHSLAQQLDSNSTYLSKVVNELYHCNFKTLINDLRVREACKRIDDEEHFGHLSIEGIGMSVGFNSRSTFNTAFKRVTGLTPSEYQRESCKNRINL